MNIKTTSWRYRYLRFVGKCGTGDCGCFEFEWGEGDDEVYTPNERQLDCLIDAMPAPGGARRTMGTGHYTTVSLARLTRSPSLTYAEKKELP